MSDVGPLTSAGEMTEFGPPEHVYVENTWYDGPRAGVADIQGVPHRFLSQFDEVGDEYLGTFLVWPIPEAELFLELEQWEIFVSWYEEYEAGKVSTELHPATPGMSKRWEEIDSLLRIGREQVPETARQARAQMVCKQNNRRYSTSGLDYSLSWRLL